MTTIYTHQFENGLTLLAEPMEWLESAAYQLAIPAGTAFEPADLAGLAGFTCEMALRGAGERSSHAVIDDFDLFGIQRDESVGAAFTQYSGACVAENLAEALTLVADLARRAHLPESELEMSRIGGIQDLRAMEDDPGERVSIELRRRAFSIPWNRIPQGDLAGYTAIDHADIRRFYEMNYRPNGAILGIAGRFEWEPLRDSIARLFGDWKPQLEPAITTVPQPFADVILHSEDATQTQLGVVWRSVPSADPDYPLAWGLTQILSGGMSARLSTTIRERCGLCYSVGAAQVGAKQEGFVFSRLATAPDQADAAHQLLLETVRRLGTPAYGDTFTSAGDDPVVGGPVTEEEVQRLRAQSKAALIMQQESSTAHAGSLVSDWYHFGRARTNEEILTTVESLTAERLNAWAPRYIPDPATILTVTLAPPAD